MVEGLINAIPAQGAEPNNLFSDFYYLLELFDVQI